MTRNYRNSWRAMWTPEPISQTAFHKSGVTARVQPDQADPAKIRTIVEITDRIDLRRWDLQQLTEQAEKLWVEGSF